MTEENNNFKKPNFKANPGIESIISENKNVPKRSPRKEVAVVWEKTQESGEKYLRIKITLPDGKEMWFNAFKNRFKKTEELHKPEYIAFENKETLNVT